MQFLRTTSAILALSAFTPVGNAAGFMSSQRSSLVARTALVNDKKGMPTVKHDKGAGDDYNKGSPLYEKQELRKKEGVESDTNMPTDSDSLEVPQVAQPHKATDFRKAWDEWHGNPKDKGYWETGIAFFLTFMINNMLAALIWMKCLKPKIIPYDQTSHDERQTIPKKIFLNMGFSYGLFSTEHCFSYDHCWPWCCGLFCHPLRLADTYSKQPNAIVKGGFVMSLVIVSCLLGLEKLTSGFSVFVFFCFAVYARQQIRKKYKINSGGMTWCHDCISWWCCPCCSMVQEARQVDFVYPPDDQKYYVKDNR